MIARIILLSMYLRELFHKLANYMCFLRIFWNFNSLVSVKRAGGTTLEAKGGMWKVNFSLKADMEETEFVRALENLRCSRIADRLKIRVLFVPILGCWRVSSYQCDERKDVKCTKRNK